MRNFHIWKIHNKCSYSTRKIHEFLEKDKPAHPFLNSFPHPPAVVHDHFLTQKVWRISTRKLNKWPINQMNGENKKKLYSSLLSWQQINCLVIKFKSCSSLRTNRMESGKPLAIENFSATLDGKIKSKIYPTFKWRCRRLESIPIGRFLAWQYWKEVVLFLTVFLEIVWNHLK